jgi:hypothetical protein
VVVSERSRGHGCVVAQTADLAVAQAVEHQREKFAGHGDAGLVGATPFRDAMEISLESGSAFVAGDSFERGPAHEPAAHLRDATAHDLGVGLAVTGRESGPRTQRLGGTEPTDVTDLRNEDRCHGVPDSGEGLDGLIAVVVAQLLWILRSNIVTSRS